MEKVLFIAFNYFVLIGQKSPDVTFVYIVVHIGPSKKRVIDVKLM